MFRRFVNLIKTNINVIVITFEIFWIIVFLLEKLSGSSGTEIPQFIYVNF